MSLATLPMVTKAKLRALVSKSCHVHYIAVVASLYHRIDLGHPNRGLLLTHEHMMWLHLGFQSKVDRTSKVHAPNYGPSELLLCKRCKVMCLNTDIVLQGSHKLFK
jgi:hypothetical protein